MHALDAYELYRFFHIGDDETVTSLTETTENGFSQTAGSTGPCAYSDLFFCHQIFSFV